MFEKNIKKDAAIGADVTVITPTHQGRERLRVVYDSLIKQIEKPKKWIIVVDGSDKATEEYVGKLITDNIDIQLVVKDHNHKKSAINLGVKLADTEFVVIADDDDPFPEDAISAMISVWNSIPCDIKKYYVGVTGLCDDGEGNVIGDRFPVDPFDSNPIESFFYYKIKGEKWGMQRRDILLKYPFFEDAEGYVGESTVWMEVGKKYKTRYFNKVVRHYVERPSSIMTTKWTKNKINKNCQAYVYGYHYSASNFIGYAWKNPRFVVGCSVSYVRFLIHCIKYKKVKRWMYSRVRFVDAVVFIVGLPLGVLLFVRDQFLDER